MSDDEEDPRQAEFQAACDEALVQIRFIGGQSDIYPVCFLRGLSMALVSVSMEYEHNEPMGYASLEEIRMHMRMGECEGTA